MKTVCLLVLTLVFAYIEQNECSMEIAFKEYLKKIIAKKLYLLEEFVSNVGKDIIDNQASICF